MSQGERMRRVDEGVREVVSSALTGSARDQVGGFVTITGAQTSPDLRHSTVFVSVFGDEGERTRVLEALEELRPELQKQLALHLRMKNTPVLKFAYDENVEQASQLNDLINKEAKYFDERSS